MAQPRTGEAGSAGLRQHAVNVALVLRSGCARERERGRPQIKVEQAIAEARLVVVVALGLGGGDDLDLPAVERSEEHTSELQSLMRISYAVFCLKKKTIQRKSDISSEGM